jgi:hypothetical protein
MPPQALSVPAHIKQVTGIDADHRTATLQFPDGQTWAVEVRPDVNLSKRKVGGQVVLRMTDAIGMWLERRSRASSQAGVRPRLGAPTGAGRTHPRSLIANEYGVAGGLPGDARERRAVSRPNRRRAQHARRELRPRARHGRMESGRPPRACDRRYSRRSS